MLVTLKSLWSGTLPLSEAFWTHLVIFGALASLTATIAAWILIDAGLPAGIAVAVQLTPAPYVLTSLVGVWRSAGRQGGDGIFAGLARGTAVVWAICLLLF